jgi:hypothetical protein
VPTVLRFGGFRFVIYPNDHRPAHVRVIGAECEAVFDLHCAEGPCELRESYRFSKSAIRRIEKQINQQIDDLCVAWEAIHGIGKPI